MSFTISLNMSRYIFHVIFYKMKFSFFSVLSSNIKFFLSNIYSYYFFNVIENHTFRFPIVKNHKSIIENLLWIKQHYKLHLFYFTFFYFLNKKILLYEILQLSLNFSSMFAIFFAFDASVCFVLFFFPLKVENSGIEN